MSSGSSMATPRSVRSLLFLLFGVCPLLFFTDLTRNPYYTQIALLNVFVPACWCVWLVASLRNNELAWVSSPLDVPFLGLGLVSLSSWLLSMAAHPAFLSSIYSEGSKSMIFLLVNTFLVYAAALRAREASLVRALLWITYVVATLAAAYGIAQFFGVELIWPRQLNPYGNRPVSTFGNPNFMSSFLVVVMPVMVADYLFKVTRFPRALLFLAIPVCLGAILATMTRSSWMGLLVGLLVLAWAVHRTDPKSARGSKALLVVMGLIVLAWPQSADSYKPVVIARLMEVKRATHEAYGSVYQRFLIWIAAFGMVQDHPWLGKGWGCFELFYPFYQGPILFLKNLAARTHANNAHNEILEYWSQIGSIGFGVVLWMWVLFFRQGAAIARRLSGGWKPMCWGMLGGVAGMLVDNLLNVSVHFAVPAFFFWWWVGSVMALDPENLKVHRVNLAPLWRKALVLLAVLGLMSLMARSFALWRGEIHFFHGFKLSKGGIDLPGAARSLERAYRWHPLEVNNNYELANVYARMGDKEKALHMYQRALDANAGYDEIYFNRATLLMQAGRDEEAIHYYRICLAINPLSQTAYNALAGLYFRHFEQHKGDVEALYLQGVRVFPADRDMWNNLGYYYTQIEAWDQAIQAYQKALHLDPSFDLAKKNLAVVSQNAKASRGSARP